MTILKKYGLPAYIIWSVISFILVILYVVVNFGFEKPLTSGYEYFNGIKIESDNLEDSEEIPIIELNITRSDTNPELNLTEMVITEYTDYEQNSYKRYGIQLLGNVSYFCPEGQTFDYDIVDYKTSSSVVGTYTFAGYSMSTNPYFYEIDVDGDVINVDFEHIDLQANDLDVTAGDTSFKLQVGGKNATYTYTNKYYSRKGWDDWNKWFDNVKTQTMTNEYTVIDLFGYLAKCFETGETSIVKSFDNMDLDKYFTITKDNGEGQYYSLSNVTTNHAYFRIKCSYNDITSHLNAQEHSIIGSIAGDVNYSSGVVNMATPYYSTGVELTLNGNEFLPVKYEALDGVVLTLSSDFRAYLLSLNNLTLNININLDNMVYDDEIVGIDFSSLGTLKITNLNVECSTSQNFYIIGSSKYVTNAVFSSSLTVLNYTGGVYA